MEHSEPAVTRPTDSPPPAAHGGMTRALISAGIFGFIGQWIGSKVGKHISNKVAQPTLRWSMGSFWALLAAYSSLKASAMERGEHVTETPELAPPAKAAEAPVAITEPAPLSLVEVDTLKDHGKLQAVPQLQLAGK